METWNQLSDDEIKMGFVASCIEGSAEKVGCNYKEMMERMEAVDLIDKISISVMMHFIQKAIRTL